MLSEKTYVVGWRKWVGIKCCDIVVVSAGRVDILTFNLVPAINTCCDASLIDSFVITSRIWVSHRSQVSTVDDQISTACVRAIEIVHSLLITALIDGFDTICIIVGECRIGKFLGQKVYTAVDYS